MTITRPHKLARSAVFATAALATGLSPVVGGAVGAQGQLTSVRIAVLEPSAGDFSAHTRLMANGLEIGVQSVNRTRATNKVQLVLDRRRFVPGTSPDRVVSGAAAAGATVVVLPCHPDLQTALAAAADRRRLVTLAPCDSDPRIARQRSRYWSIGMAGNDEAAQLVDYSLRQNAARAFIITPRSSSYAQRTTVYVRDAAKRRKLAVVGEATVRRDARDVDSLVSAINKARPNAIFAGLMAPHGEKLILALRSKGITTQIYSPSGLDVPINMTRYGAAMKDVTFTSFGFARPTANVVYLDAYQRRFKRTPYGGFPAVGFETARSLAVAARVAKSASPDALNRAFARGFRVPGVAMGDTIFQGGKRRPTNEIGLVRIVRNEYQPILAGTPPAGTVPPA